MDTEFGSRTALALAVLWGSLALLLVAAWPSLGPSLSAPLWLVGSALVFAMVITYGFSRASGSRAGRSAAFLLYAAAFGVGMFYLGAVNEHRGHGPQVVNVFQPAPDCTAVSDSALKAR